ncbi:MAG: PQQ-dependent sugar dehydrogenase, partial [Flavisolibacter sp.]|nr:PQQ-dependent sugar dehydrogenase [Flavisolibacter sp.]
EDGSYAIPDGNLFVNKPKGKPEIYVMGNRNPYRISVDKKTGFLYWGEVGPDAASDSMQTRGPRGYDEVNQARKAGYYGWPLFVGANYAYNQFDYATGTSGAFYDPAKPVNHSPNNTGLQQLPPAQPAFIWYPYAASPQFPQVGQGGRNAMAGPVYYTDDFPKATRLPDYYNNKLFIYDWIRGWIRAVTMQPNGDFDKMEPFMEGTRFAAPIDMEVGPDGRLYVLEYGSGWFSKNEDAGLVRIDYISGNRPPKVGELKIAQSSGKLPYTFTALVEAKDPEGDVLTYKWTIGKETIETKVPQLRHTISQPGEYEVSVEVSDKAKASSKSMATTVYAGNVQPQLQVRVKGNQSFYFIGRPVAYEVAVNDEGDSVNRSNLFVSVDYLQGYDKAAQNMGHQQVSGAIVGKTLVQTLDCKACHKTDEKSIGPAYIQVAQKYAAQKDAMPFLIEKILKGSAGVWGEVAMPAHPDLKKEDAEQIVSWILSLADNKRVQKTLPQSGIITPTPKKGQEVMTLQATYTDNGGGGVRPLSHSAAVVLRPALIDARDLKQFSGFTGKDSAATRYLQFPQINGSITVPKVDLTGIMAIELLTCCSSADFAGTVQIRLGTAEGAMAANADVSWKRNSQSIMVPVQKGSNKIQDIVIIYTLKGKEQQLGKPLLKAIRFVPQ